MFIHITFMAMKERSYERTLEGMDGTALTAEVKSRFPSTDILIMTGDPNLRTAVSTLKHGAAAGNDALITSDVAPPWAETGT